MTEHPVVSRPEPLTEAGRTVEDITPTQALSVALAVAAPVMLMSDAQAAAPAMLAHLNAMGFTLHAERAVHDRGADPLREAIPASVRKEAESWLTVAVPDETPLIDGTTVGEWRRLARALGEAAALGEEPHGQ